MDSFDFIIVGGGAAGCLLASRLAKAMSDRSILLIDAGGENADQSQQNFGERHWTRMTPGYSWGYKTNPQEEFDGREIDYSRGKGLGGSTAINFCVYTRGPSADYDNWAALVRDNHWRWENVQKRFNNIEHFHHPMGDFKEFADVSASGHGFQGPINVGLTQKWDPSFGDFLKKAYTYHDKNLDHNSGQPLGISICQHSTYDGKRTTASTAHLADVPANLNIITNSAITRILFEDRKAYGIEICGKKGSHHRSFYIDSLDKLEVARKQWITEQTGPLSDYYLPQMIGYFKSNAIRNSKEFQGLDSTVQRTLKGDTKPNYEVISQNPSPNVKAPDLYLATAVAFPGTQGNEQIKLESNDPTKQPVIDPKFLVHPFDRRVAIESVRETLEFLEKPLFAKDILGWAAGPVGRTDAEILQYVRKSATSMWHMCGTVKMARPEDQGTCVDTDIKVVGLQGLRVVDMSVAPLLPSAHTQAVAYPIGESAAEKMIAQYN